MIDYEYPEYEVVRDERRCTVCRLCEKQCAFSVHGFADGRMTADPAQCVNCHRCVAVCPTHALKIVKSDHCFKPSVNFTADLMHDV